MDLENSFISAADWVRQTNLNGMILSGLLGLFLLSLILALREFAAWFAHVRSVEREVHQLRLELKQTQQRILALEEIVIKTGSTNVAKPIGSLGGGKLSRPPEKSRTRFLLEQ